MTRQAFNKLGIALGLLIVCIGACCAIDAAFARGAEQETTQDITTSAASSMSEARENVVEALASKDHDPVVAAKSLFDLEVSAELPPAFIQEAIDIEPFEEAYASGSTISLTFAGPPEEAAQVCADALKAKGWYALESNDRAIQSFAKAEGSYRWLVLQFLNLGNKTVVLVSIIDHPQ